ncbi:MAG: TonB-dependent receptor [Melioribacteraceae bacterium]|nr:TonB-dependent receptor [Melioribacteraceae bacterium]
MRLKFIAIVFTGLSILLSYNLFAGQTGKIAGKVTDSQTGEPVIGANIIVDGTYLGAASDIDGYYFINNVPPGVYSVVVSSIGYKKTTVTEVQVRIDLTTNVDVELVSESVELGQDVVVVADKPLVIKDLTSTSATVSSREIDMMPVESIGQIINLQAGVIGGHFRGGRSNEVSYLIDGLPVTDAFNGQISVEVENNSIRELEIISGTFNAEYGQAMSGIVNIVTKEGNQNFEGSATAYFGNYLSKDDGIYENLDRFSFRGIKDFQFSLSGPTKILNSLTFFVTGRYFNDEGSTFGKRVYNTSDYFWFMPTGDGEYVSMNPWEKYSLNGKLTYNLPSWKFSYSLFWDKDERSYYDHAYRWTPDGILNHFSKNMIHNVQMSFIPSQSTFTSLKFSANRYEFYGYLYEDPFDPRYVNPIQGNPSSGYTYRQGGNQSWRYKRFTESYIGQWTFESQVSREHKFKMGVEGRITKIFNHSMNIINKAGDEPLTDTGIPAFELGYPELHARDNQQYTKFPYEISAYIQDKMEYDIMIINAGLRLDYFNANTSMPADLRNALNNPDFPGYNERVEVDAKMQLSPRIGVSFPISDQGAIYFSYGHFFQIPTFENLYANDEYIIIPGQSLSSYTGNPDLDVQKTVQYELGLQQVIFPNVSLDLTVYYRDIRNLLGMEIINTYEGSKYARFINRDYGNTKGFIITLDKRFADYFSAKIDYTYQLAEGNSSDPMAVYNDNQTDPPVESEKHLVPLNWDQRSTINFTANVGEPGDWNVGLIFQYGSGQPYTEDIRISNGVRFENGGRKPTFYSLDLKADKFFSIGPLSVNAFLLVYNVLDIRNEFGVYGTTGRANADLNVKFAGEVIGYNTIDEYLKNPGNYSAPRQIRLGLRVGF